MTNGEKIEEIFPNVEISPDPYSPSVDVYIGTIMMMRVDRNWWNAEYKEPRKALEQEPILDKIRFNEPMQVELEGDGYADGELVYDYGKCPKCGWDFEYGDKDWGKPYCCHCGQKLKWFDNETESAVNNGNNNK